MTRDEVIELYRPIRAAIQRILKDAVEFCRDAELRRAVSQIAPWADDSQFEGCLPDMMVDLVVFERDRRGKRGLDRMLADKKRRLTREDRAVLKRMSHAWFSLFRVAERHDAAGIWLEDLLDGDRRVWLMDESMEASAPENLIVGVRLFEAGSFHAAFGLITQPGDEMLGACLAARARRQPLPDNMSLAAMAYADHLAEEMPMNEDEMDALDTLAELFMPDPATLIEHEPRKAKAAPRLEKPLRRKAPPRSRR